MYVWWSLSTLVLWLHTLTLSLQSQDNKVQLVYVSQSRGRDNISCGLESNPCKTIVMGVWRVQHDGQVYVDGTGSETTPYTCKSSALELAGIHSNKSMVIIGVQSIPHVQCQEGYDIRLNQLPLDHNETTVQLTNLQFVNTSVSAQDINLYIDNCIFTGAAQAVNLVLQSTSAVTLSFSNSLCVNVSSCIATRITQTLTPKNINLVIYITNSNIVTSWWSQHQSPVIHVTSTGEYDPGSITCRIAARNVSFEDNVLGPQGLIYINFRNGFTSLYLENVVFLRSRTAMSMFTAITVVDSYNLDMFVNNTKFIENEKDCNWCRAINVEILNRSSVYILNSHFEKFQAAQLEGLVYLNSHQESELYIENSTFTRNVVGVKGTLSVISQMARVTLKDSTFSNNIGGCGGILWVSASDLVITTIQGCHFESNGAHNPAGLAAFRGKEMYIEVIDSKVNGSTSGGPGGVFDIGYTGCGSSLLANNVTVLFKNFHVIGSFSEGPGGVAAIKASNGLIIIQDSSMKDTRATGQGGAIAAFFVKSGPSNFQTGLDIKILNSTFTNSRTLNPGGLLYSNGTRLTLESVKIDSAVAGGGPGGGVFIEASNVTININNLVIKNCLAGYGPGGAMYFQSVSTLTITNSVFESNTASSGVGGCLFLPTGISATLLRNVTFKNCQSLFTPGGAIYFSDGGGQITIESCKFIGNKSPRSVGGAIAFDLPNRDKIIDPGCISRKNNLVRDSSCTMQGSVAHRVWRYYTSVTIKNTVFVNNTAANGGALSLSRGNHTCQNCSFIDNFANLQGGHIYVISDSTSLQILDSTFLQQRSSIKINSNTYGKGSFIDSQSAGPLIILNSTLESKSSLGKPETLVTVSKANYVNFGENNKTVLTCSRGSKLEMSNLSIYIDTEYQSIKCIVRVNVMELICKPCGIGTYSLQRSQRLGTRLVSGFQCLTCPYGAECLHKIAAKPNFWGYKVQGNPLALNFTLCPLGYCKQPDKLDFVDYNSCHGNRTGPLCGECKENYTETLLSPSCRRQDECRDTWLWGVAVVMVMLMALYLIYKPRFSRMLKSHILWFRSNTSQDDEEDQSKRGDGGGYLKIVFYFYQVANIVLITTSYNSIVENYLLQSVVGIFNFEFRLSSRGLLCPFVGLTVVTKQLLFACPVFGVLLMIAMCYGSHCLLHKCLLKSRPTLGPYLGAVLETLLLGYAVFANTALKLLRCVSLGGVTRLFIAGNVLCYHQWWQYLLMVFVAVVVVPFIVTLALGSRWLYKSSISIKEFFLGCVIPLPYLMYKLVSLLCRPREPRPEPPDWKASVTAVLYGPFRNPQDNTTGAIYWESVLIFRRLVLIVIYAFVTDPLSKELLLTFSCVLILFHHTIVRPFRSQGTNIAEMISLISLVAIATINTFNASFLSTGQVPQGPLKSFAHALNWIQVLILIAVPLLFLGAVLTAILSQIIRLVVKLCGFVTCSCIRSRGWHVISDDNQDLLEPLTSED